MIRFEEDLGPIRIASSNEEAERLAEAGWILKAVIQETVSEVIPVTKQDLNPLIVGSYSCRTEDEVHPETKTRYLFAMGREEALIKLQAELVQRDEVLGKAQAEIESLRAQVKTAEDTEKHLKEALGTCRAFAEAEETLKAELKSVRWEFLKNVQEFKALRNQDKNIQRLMALEDWITELYRKEDIEKLHEALPNLGPFPIVLPKTWAERLGESDG